MYNDVLLFSVDIKIHGDHYLLTYDSGNRIKQVICTDIETGIRSICRDEGLSFQSMSVRMNPDGSATGRVYCERSAASPRKYQRCPDCNGSGRYIGLNAIEPCRTCQGLGIA